MKTENSTKNLQSIVQKYKQNENELKECKNKLENALSLQELSSKIDALSHKIDAMVGVPYDSHNELI